MELQKFKETLLEFLSDVTNIPEKAKATFLTSHLDDSWKPNKAPNRYNVLTPFLLVRETISTRIPDRPRPTPEEGQETTEEKEKEEIFLCRINFNVFTETHRYSISGVWKEYHPQYLGCIASTRMPRVGEDWTRGNDLLDGYFCKETWEHIKNAIIRYEMKALSKYIVNGHWTPQQADEVQVKVQKV